MENHWTKNYPEGVSSSIDVTEFKSINDLLESSFNKFSHKPAFHNMGKTLSFREMDTLSGHFASFLQHELKLARGARIALMMPNVLQYPVALFGLLRAGMVAVNINPLYTARELQHQLKDSGAEAIVIFANSASCLEQIVSQTNIKHIIVTEIGDMLSPLKKHLVNFVIKRVKKMVPNYTLKGSYKFNQALEIGEQKEFQRVEMDQSETAFLQYTGGTTGVAKGAVLSHGNIVANMLQAREWIKRDIVVGEEIIITPLPLYHIFSLTANCFIYNSIGALNVLITNPRDIPGFVKELQKWDFTSITGVNTLFNALLSNEDFKALDFSSLRISLGGGMAVQRAVAEEWKKVTGVTLVEAYGLTETSPAACINPMDLAQYNGFIGLPIPNTVVKIKDDKGSNLELGEESIGEICISGPQVMQGYWQRPEETKKVMTEDGFFRTGDIGYMNNDGFVKIVDRKKDMILVSGFNVYPNEVEDVVIAHPKVFECAVIGVPHSQSGEMVKVYVVKRDQSLDEDELKKYCRENLTAYKVPKLYEFVTDLPKSPVGKVLRKELRKLAS